MRGLYKLIIAALLSVAAWFYMQQVLIPYQIADAAAHNRPRGILSDLYPRWLATRELLLHHHDPYSYEVTQEIQKGYYGRLLDPTRPNDPKDEQRFAYPLYVAFLLGPFVHLPFPAVRVMFTWGLALLTLLSVLLWLRVVEWQPSRPTILVLLMLTVSSIPTIQGIKLQQLSLLVAGLIAAAMVLLCNGYLAIAGVVVAFATIKPQLVFLLIFWLTIWTLADWKRRHRFLSSFLMTAGILVGAAEYLLPGWISEFAHGLSAYERYTGGQSLLDVLATRTGGALLTILAILGTVGACWRARRTPADSAIFKLMLAFALAVTVVIVPMMAPYNQLLLLPAVFLILQSWGELWARNGLNRIALTVTALVVVWPWAASVVLMLARFVEASAKVQKAWAVPLWTSIAIPLAVLVVLFPMLTQALRKLKVDTNAGYASMPSGHGSLH